MGCASSKPPSAARPPAGGRPVLVVALGLPASAGVLAPALLLAATPPPAPAAAAAGDDGAAELAGSVDVGGGGARVPARLIDLCPLPPALWPPYLARAEALVFVVCPSRLRSQQEELDRALASAPPSLPAVLLGAPADVAALQAELAPGGMRPIYRARGPRSALALAVRAALAPQGRLPDGDADGG